MLPDFDHRQAVRGLALADIIGIFRKLRRPVAIDDVAICVFVVYRENMGVALGKQSHAVGIVAESPFLAFPGAAGGLVEVGSVRPERLTPFRNHMPAVSVGNGHRVLAVCGNGGEAEPRGRFG